MSSSKNSKRKIGRPTKYRPEYCERIIEHLKQGLTFESFAASIPDNGVNIDTIHEWAKKHPEFAEAKKRGAALTHAYWDKIALLVACGKEYIDKNGNVVVDPKNIIPSVFIFTLKNRIKWRDTPIEDAPIDNNKHTLIINQFKDEKK